MGILKQEVAGGGGQRRGGGHGGGGGATGTGGAGAKEDAQKMEEAARFGKALGLCGGVLECEWGFDLPLRVNVDTDAGKTDRQVQGGEKERKGSAGWGRGERPRRPWPLSGCSPRVCSMEHVCIFPVQLPGGVPRWAPGARDQPTGPPVPQHQLVPVGG